MWITRIAIDRPVFATMVLAALAVLGLLAYADLGVEQMPNIRAPVLHVSVSYPGASPEQVEADITRPIEDALNATPGTRGIVSESGEGYAWITLDLRLGIDTAVVAQEVRDRLAAVRDGLPRDAGVPVVERGGAADEEPVVAYALRAAGSADGPIELRQLSTAAEQRIKKAFERVEGVGRVTLNGTATRQIEVRVDPDKMVAYGLTIDDVVQAVRAAQVAAPVGTVSDRRTTSVLRVDGRFATPQEFRRVVVSRRHGTPILLEQLAEVVDTERERDAITRIDGQPAVGVSVFKSQDANVVALGRRLALAADDLQRNLPPGMLLTKTWSLAEVVTESVDNVKRTIVEGAVLTIVVVFLFLGSWRSTVITGLTLPIAVVSTFSAMQWFGFTLNYMTLMALSLCIGLLIDDAIVVRENIVRHLRMGKAPHVAAREGTEEIGLAVLATTLSIVAVFVPIAFTGGMVGEFFYPFGITVSVAVLVSLFVSFTLDPMLSAVWHDPPDGLRRSPVVGPVLKSFNAGIERCHRAYRSILKLALGRRRSTLVLAVGSLAVTLPVVTLVGTEVIPPMDRSFIALRLTLPAGASLEYGDERIRRVEEALRRFPEIESIQTSIGGGAGKRTAQLGLRLVPPERRNRTQDELEFAIRERIQGFSGIEARVGWGSPIELVLLGEDTAALAHVMTDLRRRLESVPGITDIEVSPRESAPAMVVRLKPEQVADDGMTHAQLGSTLRALVHGENSGHWMSPEGQNLEVITRLPRADRSTTAQIERLHIATGRTLADGSPEVAPLGVIATFTKTANPESIERQDLKRRVVLRANVHGRPVGDAARDVRLLVDGYALPDGVRADLGGESRDQEEVNTAIVRACALAVIFIYMVLASQFGSFLQPLAIMASLPLALGGVLLALLVTGSTLNVFSMIGVVFLFGLVTKNAILLIDFANREVLKGQGIEQALLRAGQVRLRPILMTTAAMIFGMLPLALGWGPGGEQQAPMGRAIIGGLLSSSALTLVVVPVVYSYLRAWETKWGRRRSDPVDGPRPARQPLEGRES